MFGGLSFANEARKLWKRLRREIRKATDGKPVDQVLAAYLLRKQKKSVALCAAKLLERYAAMFAHLDAEDQARVAEGMVGAVLGRYFQHKL